MEQRFVNWPNQSALQSISLCFTIYSRAKPVSITTNISLFYHPFTDSDRRELQHAVMSVIVTHSIKLEDARRTQRRLSALLLSEIQTDRQRFPVSNHLHRFFARNSHSTLFLQIDLHLNRRPTMRAHTIAMVCHPSVVQSQRIFLFDMSLQSWLPLSVSL